MSLCVYGPKIGYSSMEVVTRGMIEAAIEHGYFAGHVPTGRSYDEHDLYRGRDSSCAVLCGGYPELPMLAYGSHQYRSFMLAANSSWIPDGFWAHAREHVSEILTPSKWSLEQIENSRPKGCDIPARVVPHGVLANFRPLGPMDDKKVKVCGPPGKFVISHFAGSSMERKGTMELVKAFMAWPQHKECFLFLCLNAMQAKPFSIKMADTLGQDTSECIAIVPPLNAEPLVMREVYAASDIVCQPSRAEGFGLVPLEALACGVPVVATAGTGHLQWLTSVEGVAPGVVPVEVGPPSRVEYDPGGLAPTVSVDAVMASLDYAFNGIGRLRKEAKEASSMWREKWSWANQTKRWMSELRERYSSDDQS